MGKKFLRIILLLTVLIGLAGAFNSSSVSEVPTDINNNELQASNSWDLLYPIVIDNNWSDTRDFYDWCSGSGTIGNPYIIENVSINGQDMGFCIKIYNSNEFFILKNCKFYNINGDRNICIELSHVKNGTIINSEISNNEDFGMRIEYCENISISDNKFLNNPKFHLVIEYCNNFLILNNHFEENEFCTLIRISSSEDIVIRENEFDIPLSRYFCGYISIDQQMSYIWFIKNLVKNTRLKIQSTYCNIEDNVFIGEWSSGILLSGDNTSIWNNSFSGFEYGINFRSDSYYHGENKFNSICCNTFENNEVGISLGSNSFYNTISKNIVKNNNKGISVKGMNNTIYHNIFENKVVNAEDEGLENKWNNSDIGNYWHDYGGIDVNDDGIGDSPYTIPNPSGGLESQDYFPIWYTEPEISIITPLNNSHWNEEPLIHVIATDHNLNCTWYEINNQSEFLESDSSEYLRADIWDSLPEGPFLIEFYANDTINVNDNFKYILTKDTVLPTISVQSPLDYTEYKNTSPEFTVTVFDTNLHQTWYSLNEQEDKYFLNNTHGVINITAWNSLPDGNVSITFWVSDKAGNTANQKVTVIKITQKQIDGYKISVLLIGVLTISIIIVILKKNRLYSNV